MRKKMAENPVDNGTIACRTPRYKAQAIEANGSSNLQ
jgi:hypothetical protein